MHEIYVVDAFHSEQFRGNPAGVCLLHGGESDAWLQSVAAEVNASETAFVLLDSRGYSLRYFTGRGASLWPCHTGQRPLAVGARSGPSGSVDRFARPGGRSRCAPRG